MPVVDPVTLQSTRPGVFFGGDSAFGPKNIIWAVAHAHEAAISIHNHCSGEPVTERPPQGMNLITQKMGLAEWSYSNDYNPAKRAKMKHVDLRERFAKLRHRGRAGVRSRADRARGRTLPELRHADGVQRRALHRVRRLRRRLPGALPDHRAQRRGGRAARAADGPARRTGPGAVRVGRAAADRACDGQGRGRLRSLRAVRRALPDSGLGHGKVRASSPTQDRTVYSRQG